MLEQSVRLFTLALVGVLFLVGCGDGSGSGQKSPAASEISGAGQKAPTGRLDRSHAGTPAPEILFRNPDGEPATFAEFEGKPLLVNLWATWCAPCIVEMPSLDELAARENSLQVLALSQDMAGAEKVDAFFAERKFRELEAYVDPELAMMSSLSLDTLPTTILYDAKGREVWRMTGMEDWTGPRAARLLKEAEG